MHPIDKPTLSVFAFPHHPRGTFTSLCVSLANKQAQTPESEGLRMKGGREAEQAGIDIRIPPGGGVDMGGLICDGLVWWD